LRAFRKKIFFLFFSVSILTSCGSGGDGVPSEKSDILNIVDISPLSVELKDRATYNSKVFDNGDGTLTSIISEAPIHYYENKQWNDIDTNFTKKLSGKKHDVGVEKNNFKVYFDNTEGGFVKSLVGDDVYKFEIVWQGKTVTWRPLRIGWEKGGVTTAIEEPKGTTAVTKENRIQYDNVYSNIDEEFVILPELFKHNIMIKAPFKDPQEADYFVYQGVLKIGDGIEVIADDKTVNDGEAAECDQITLKTSDGAGVIPVSFAIEENPNADEEIKGHYRIKREGTDILFSILIPAKWIQSKDRAYPIRIDPTITLPNASTADFPNLTGYIWLNGASYSKSVSSTDGIKTGKQPSTSNDYRGFAEWNITSIPSNATITASKVYLTKKYFEDVNADGSMSTKIYDLATRPSTASASTIRTDAADGSYYGYIQWFSSNTTKSLSLGSTGNTEIKNNLSSGWYGVGLTPMTSVDPDDRVYFHSNTTGTPSTYPLLEVTYTTTASGDIFEPDNTSGQAKVLINGTCTNGHSLVPTGDVDWKYFVLSSTSDVTLETVGPSGDTEMWLYNSSLTQIAYDDDSGEGALSKIVKTNLAPGTYYAKVSEYGNDAQIASYEWSFSATPSLISKGALGGKVTSATSGINVKGAEVLLGECSCSDCGTCGYAVTDDNGNYLISNMVAGTYHIDIWTTGYLDYSGSVTVLGNTTTIKNYQVTPNFEALAVNTSYLPKSVGLKEYRYYKFDKVNGWSYSINVHPSTANDDPDVYTHWTTAASMATYQYSSANGSGSTETISFTATESGTYYIAVYGFKASSFAIDISATAPAVDDADFVTDVTIPDGTDISAGQGFTKTWRLKNSGNTTWTTSYKLCFYSGSQMGAASCKNLTSNVYAGNNVDISVAMTAPSTPGSYTGNWKMKNAAGTWFGDTVYVTIDSINNPPNQCTLTAPSNGAQNQPITVMLDWACTDPDAGDSIVDYKLQLSTDPGFSNLLWNAYIGTSSSQWQPSAHGINLSPDTYYYWRVYGKDTHGDISPLWSPWSFKTAAAKPDFIPDNASIKSVTSPYTGATLTVEARLRNIGKGSANNVGNKIRLRNIATGQYYTLTNVTPSSVDMAADYNEVKQFSGKIPDNCTFPYQGEYEAEIQLDPNDVYDESIEGNNVTTTPNVVFLTRYIFCGGDTPPPDENDDFDSDGFKDIEEKYAGTKVTVAETSKKLFDPSYYIYLPKKTDQSYKNYDADPVNIRTGAFEFTQTDFKLPGRGPDIDFTRTYNSRLFERSNRLGNGWSFSYNSFYYKDPATGNVQIYHGGMLASMFYSSDGGQTFTAPPGVYDTLAWDGETLVYKRLDGTKYIYSKTLTGVLGLLESIKDTNSNSLTFTYTSARGDVPLLSEIKDASGRTVSLTYGNEANDLLWDKIVELKENANPQSPRIVNYEYDESGNLIHVKENRTYKGTTEYVDRYFTYDATGKMLTYTDPRGTILYNEFDAEGRVVKQYEHNPNKDAEGNKRLVYELSYEGPNANAPDSTHCTLVKNYRDADAFYSSRYCFDADELKNYQEDGLGNSEKWEYNDDGMPAKYTDKNGNITLYEYDAERRLTKETPSDAGGWHVETIYSYEDKFNRLTQKQSTATHEGLPSVTKTFKYTIDNNNGNILNIEDPQGNKDIFSYDPFGNPLTHADKNGNTTSFAYDANGNYPVQESIMVQQPDGSSQLVVKTNAYDSYGNRTQFTTPEGHVYSYLYDNRNNLREETDPAGASKVYTYDMEDHRVSEANELGKITNYTYDKDINASLVKIEKVGSVENITVQKAYDWTGNLIKEADPLGNETAYTYDAANRVTNKQLPYDSIDYSYDAAGNITAEENSLGQKAAYLYDARNRRIEMRRHLSNDEYLSIFDDYDAFGRITRHTDANGNITQFEYNLIDKLTKQTDQPGNITTYAYDNNGNRIGMTNPRAQSDGGLKNSDGFSVSYFYDGLNRQTKTKNAADKEVLQFYNKDGRIVKVVDGTHIAQFDYDLLGRKTAEKDSYNKSIAYTYDSVGNVKSRTDREGRAWTYSYDDFNRLVEEKDAANNIKSYTYDKSGNKTAETYPDGKTTTFTYDAQNRLTKVTDSIGNAHKFTYDAVGNKTKEEDKLGNQTEFAYDKLNRLASEKNPQDTVTTYTYDNNGNKLSESIAGKAASFAYDALNRATSIVHQGGKSEAFAYDGDGNVTSKTDGNNKTITFIYDALNRPTKKTLPGGFNVLYVYDKWNNITSLTDESGTTDYTYDTENRPVTEQKTISGIDGKTYTIARSYYSDGRLKSLTDAAGQTINYEYNNRALLSAVKKGAQPLANYAYTATSRISEISYANGVKSSYAYDDLRRPTSIIVKDAGLAVLFKHEYGYDAENNRTSLVEDGTKNYTYTYDDLGQLITAGDGTKTVTFAYDAWGNRTSLATPSGNTAYTYAANSNELTDYTESERLKVNVAYDGNGSVIQNSYERLGKNIKTVDFAWDGQNRLSGIKYTLAGRPAFMPALPDNVLSFVYDDSGNRVAKKTNGATVYYINNGLRVQNELDGAGEVKKSVVDGIGQVAELDAQGKITYTHQDVLGSTVLLTDEAGKVVQKYKYDVFGSLTGKTGLAETKYLYTGQEYDFESELYYYNARYYNPQLGRFISRDEFAGKDGDSVSKNRYVYVKNNPFKYVDPSGKILDTILDVGFILFDVGVLVYDIIDTGGDNWEINTAALVVDVGCAVVPFATGGGMVVRAGKTLSKVDDVLDVGKVIDKTTDAGKVIDKVYDGSKPISELTQVEKNKIKGDAGEYLAGIYKEPKTKIEGINRVPDNTNVLKKEMLEVKNVKELGGDATKQIVETATYAKDNGYRYILETRETTKITKPVQNLIDQGIITHQGIGYSKWFDVGQNVIGRPGIIANPFRYISGDENVCSLDNK